MSQLLIIDIQTTYKDYISDDLISKIPIFGENFSEILYLWDNVSGQEFYEEIPSEWLENHSDFYNRLFSFTKNYAFFRGLMDLGVCDEDIICLGKFMLENNVFDCREIFEDVDLKKKYNKKFKNSSFHHISFEDHSFYLPDDLIKEIQERIRPGVVLIGGGFNECLKEVSLLLKVLEIDHSINLEYTY